MLSRQWLVHHLLFVAAQVAPRQRAPAYHTIMLRLNRQESLWRCAKPHDRESAPPLSPLPAQAAGADRHTVQPCFRMPPARLSAVHLSFVFPGRSARTGGTPCCALSRRLRAGAWPEAESAMTARSPVHTRRPGHGGQFADIDPSGGRNNHCMEPCGHVHGSFRRRASMPRVSFFWTEGGNFTPTRCR